MRHTGGVILLLLGTAGVRHAAGVPAESLRFVSVTAGADHACALTGGGEAYCWGSNEFGQLGIGFADATPHTKPARVSGDVKFTMIAAGSTHACGLTRDGSVFCWGANDSAQLGDGTIKNSPTPLRVATDVRFKAIGPGGTHTCAVSVDSVGYCWGGNWHGQLGVGNRDGDTGAPCCYRVPTQIRTELRFDAIVAGGIDSCGIAVDGKAYCWGSPQEGRLGTGAADAEKKSVDKVVPTAVAGDLTFTAVVPRAYHTCGLSSTSVVLCWGGNVFQMESAVPNRIGAADANFTVVSTGLIHDCALSRDGVPYCWGQNTDGEIGDGTTRAAAAPQRVATNRRFASIAAGGNVFVVKPGEVMTWGFTCGLTMDDANVLCWGDNRHGALGNGSTKGSLTPVPISSPGASQ